MSVTKTPEPHTYTHTHTTSQTKNCLHHHHQEQQAHALQWLVPLVYLFPRLSLRPFLHTSGKGDGQSRESCVRTFWLVLDVISALVFAWSLPDAGPALCYTELTRSTPSRTTENTTHHTHRRMQEASQPSLTLSWWPAISVFKQRVYIVSYSYCSLQAALIKHLIMPSTKKYKTAHCPNTGYSISLSKIYAYEITSIEAKWYVSNTTLKT